MCLCHCLHSLEITTPPKTLISAGMPNIQETCSNTLFTNKYHKFNPTTVTKRDRGISQAPDQNQSCVTRVTGVTCVTCGWSLISQCNRPIIAKEVKQKTVAVRFSETSVLSGPARFSLVWRDIVWRDIVWRGWTGNSAVCGMCGETMQIITLVITLSFVAMLHAR